MPLFPAGHRNNFRYRGPVESRKLSEFYKYNIKNSSLLKQTLDVQEENLNVLKSSLNNENRRNLHQGIVKLFDALNELKGGQ